MPNTSVVNFSTKLSHLELCSTGNLCYGCTEIYFKTPTSVGNKFRSPFPRAKIILIL